MSTGGSVSGSRPDSGLFVLEYDWPSDHGAAVRDLYEKHRAHVDALGAAGAIWMIGALPAAEDREGALAVFRTREGAERFIMEDPLFRQGLVRSRGIRRWSPLIFTA